MRPDSVAWRDALEHGLGHGGGAVARASIRKQQRRKPERPVDFAGEGIEQQLGRVEAVAARGGVRSMGAQAIALAFGEAVDPSIEDIAAALAQWNAIRLLVLRIEQADLDAIGMA